MHSFFYKNASIAGSASVNGNCNDDVLLKAVADREVMQEWLDKVTAWIEEKEKAFDPKQKLPLTSADVHKQAEEKKVNVLIFSTFYSIQFLFLFIDRFREEMFVAKHLG